MGFFPGIADGNTSSGSCSVAIKDNPSAAVTEETDWDLLTLSNRQNVNQVHQEEEEEEEEEEGGYKNGKLV